MPQATRIPFIPGHQLILVPVLLNRTKAFRFVVDTGAQRIIISHYVADTLGLDADGLLGLNFLRQFRVTFEFDRSTMILRPVPDKASRVA